jgi:hypothetical protein
MIRALAKMLNEGRKCLLLFLLLYRKNPKKKAESKTREVAINSTTKPRKNRRRE